MVDLKRESLCQAYGQTLVELGAREPRLVVLDADLSNASQTSLFGRAFPERFFNVGIMESTMITIASGFALSGRVAFASTSCVFAAGQSYHMIRESVCRHRANVKIVATHPSLFAGSNSGPPPMLEDIGLMRGLPGMTVVVPADPITTRTVTNEVAEFRGPVYVRLTQENLPPVTEGKFQLGHANELRSGSDLTLVACGAMVVRALEVADELRRVGVGARVLDFASIKPFDAPSLLRAARETGAILTMEEHSTLTGLGALVASTTSENYPVPVRRVGVPDVFGGSGTPQQPLNSYGLSRERVVDEAWELLQLRGKVS
jgi:transketolase